MFSETVNVSSSSQYNPIRLLGKGGFGVASLVSSVSDPTTVFVIKQVDIANIERRAGPDGAKIKNMAFQEADFMKSIDHPNIVKVFCSFIGKRYVNLVILHFLHHSSFIIHIRSKNRGWHFAYRHGVL